MALPPITKKQQEILLLIPRFRFLNRIQIQTFLNHKNKKTINTWLPDLVKKEYLKRIYSTNFGENTKPAVYYLGINGIRWLKTNSKHSRQYLRKLSLDKNRTERFISQCLQIADIYLDFLNQNTNQIDYLATTEGEYSVLDCPLHFLTQTEALIHPNLVIKKTKDNQLRTWYLLEYFEETLPNYRVKKRLKNYLEFYWSNEWENNTSNPFPIILFIFSTKAEMIYAKRYTKNLLGEEQKQGGLTVRFSLEEKINQLGVTGHVWEEI